MSEDTKLEVIEGAGDGAAEAAAEQKKPFLTVVKGNPTDDEIGVLTALFATVANNASGAAADTGPINKWGDLGDYLDRPLFSNPSAFRNASFF
ncbi:MAG: acyl-CoA carboxylase subunit epsilon [Corynebacterium sp.]|nr:acyl-CoA carboxylase subunit epsilon [Corynebacterium sp.]